MEPKIIQHKATMVVPNEELTILFLKCSQLSLPKLTSRRIKHETLRREHFKIPNQRHHQSGLNNSQLLENFRVDFYNIVENGFDLFNFLMTWDRETISI